MLRPWVTAAVTVVLFVSAGPCRAEDRDYTPATADEPVAAAFSALKAAEALDTSATWWQENHGCCHCHANMMYLVARPSLDAVVRSDLKVRAFFENLVQERWEHKGLRYEPEAVVVAVPLAIHDRRTTGTLHPATRKALDRMISLQRPEGNWTLLQAGGKRTEVAGERKAFFLGYEQMLFAAIGIAVAPGEYARSDMATEALRKVRKYVREHPPQTPHQKGMTLWAASHVDGLLDSAEQKRAVEHLLGLQCSDGGWATEDLAAGSPFFEPVRSAEANRSSDGYGTGFVIYVTRQAGVPAADERLQKGIKWLKAHQRQSGRWFVPSFNNRPNSVLSYSGTAYAVLALEACGELSDAPGK